MGWRRGEAREQPVPQPGDASNYSNSFAAEPKPNLPRSLPAVWPKPLLRQEAALIAHLL